MILLSNEVKLKLIELYKAGNRPASHLPNSIQLQLLIELLERVKELCDLLPPEITEEAKT